MTLVMYDSIEVSAIPAHAEAVAGYVGGRWPTYAELVSKFPKAHHLSIAVNAGEQARCLDIETGDAVASQAPLWLRTNVVGKGKPVLYTYASNVETVINTCAAAGFARGHYLIWSAHTGRGMHICGPLTCGYPQADGTQWTFDALGRNLDQSLLEDAFFEIAPPAVNPHYDWYYTGPFSSPRWGKLNERAIVTEYDKLRKHPFTHHNQLSLLKQKLTFLAHRIYVIAETDRTKHNTPSWGKFNRGWRFQEISKRGQGRKVV